jgi:hypothetical protein
MNDLRGRNVGVRDLSAQELEKDVDTGVKERPG